ncbi:hypothetical protein V6000_009007 [Aspergillus fumigatus]
MEHTTSFFDIYSSCVQFALIFCKARGKEDAAADAGDDLVDDDLGPAEVGVDADVQACGEGHKRVPVQMDGLLSAPAGEGEAGEDGSPPGIVGALHHFIASET